MSLQILLSGNVPHILETITKFLDPRDVKNLRAASKDWRAFYDDQFFELDRNRSWYKVASLRKSWRCNRPRRVPKVEMSSEEYPLLIECFHGEIYVASLNKVTVYDEDFKKRGEIALTEQYNIFARQFNVEALSFTVIDTSTALREMHKYDHNSLRLVFKTPWPWQILQVIGPDIYAVEGDNFHNCISKLDPRTGDPFLYRTLPLDPNKWDVDKILVQEDTALVLAISHGFFSHSHVMYFDHRKSKKVLWSRDFKDHVVGARILMFEGHCAFMASTFRQSSEDSGSLYKVHRAVFMDLASGDVVREMSSSTFNDLERLGDASFQTPRYFVTYSLQDNPGEDIAVLDTRSPESLVRLNLQKDLKHSREISLGVLGDKYLVIWLRYGKTGSFLVADLEAKDVAKSLVRWKTPYMDLVTKGSLIAKTNALAVFGEWRFLAKDRGAEEGYVTRLNLVTALPKEWTGR